MENEELEEELVTTELDNEELDDTQEVVTEEDTDNPINTDEEDQQTDESGNTREKTFTQEQVQKMIAARVARERRALEKDKKDYEKLANLLQAGGYKGNNISALTEEMIENYKLQGIEIPNFNSTLSEREEKILAKAEAEEIMALEESEEVANAILELKNKSNKSYRDKIVLQELEKKLSLKNAEMEFEKQGIDKNILYDEKFKEFAKKFSVNTTLYEIYNLYEKANNRDVQPKRNPGSLANKPTKIKKTYYTSEEVDKLTEEDFEDEEIFKAVQNSMTKW